MNPRTSRLLSCSAATLALFFLSGCLILPQQKKVLAVHPPSAQPPALKLWHADSTVRFLLVHGMNNHPFGTHGKGPHKGDPILLGHPTYTHLVDTLKTLPPEKLGPYGQAAAEFQFKEFIESYAAKNQLVEEAGKVTPIGFNIIKRNGDVLGYLYRRSFKPAGGRAGHPVEFYVTSWALGACVAKEQAYGSHDGTTIDGTSPDHFPAINARRHPVNRAMKHSVVNWGLTDAAIYRGDTRKDFEWAVVAAMNRLVGELSDAGTDQTVIVTASLGSTITYHALQTLLGDSFTNDSVAWTEKDRQKLKNLFYTEDKNDKRCKVAFYMFANQYGLLTAGPAAQGKSATALQAESPAQTLSAAVQQNAPSSTMRREIPLVAFSDPDDLLTYHLPAGSGSVTVTNVYVQNNGLKFVLPVLGGVTNPIRAHNTYGENPSVLSFMRHGR